MTHNPRVTVIGGGLAGCEAASQLARRGVVVTLYEMRPEHGTAAHRTGSLAELVCSNSLKSLSLERGPGLLKEEMRRLGSLVIECAQQTAVPAGTALAVDREAFSRCVEATLGTLGDVEVIRREVLAIPDDGLTIVATGPLTSPAMAETIRDAVGAEFLHFYDAVSPIVAADSVDMTIAFAATRYDKGEGEYINCPMTREEYEAFLEALLSAEVAESRQIPQGEFFEGCLPMEELARRHPDALRFGPMKPVGLVDPRTGRRPYACLQLRPENRERTMVNLVGCQTGLKWGEQDRLIRMVPGLAEAEILRYGVMHRNLFLDSPRCLDEFCRLRRRETLYFAGQITGVEGYVESAMSGLYAGANAARQAAGREPLRLPAATMCGALMRHLQASGSPDFQPMNANFGLLPPVEVRVPKKQRKLRAAERALEALDAFLTEEDW